jgi:hypothetical protein
MENTLFAHPDVELLTEVAGLPVLSLICFLMYTNYSSVTW